MNIYGEVWHILKQNMLDKLSSFISNKYHKLNEKLQQLMDGQSNNTRNNNKKCKIRSKHCEPICKPDTRYQFQFHDPIKNLSHVQFNNNEMQVIQENYKSNFNVYKNNQIMDTIIVESEDIIRNNNHINQEFIRHKISDVVQKQIQQKLDNNIVGKNRNVSKHNPVEIKKIVEKIRDNNLTVNNADKGNIIVIEEKNQLQNKTKEFLNNPKFKKLKSDPTARYQNQIKNKLKSSDLLIQPQYINHYINSKPKAPILEPRQKYIKKIILYVL